MGLKTKRLPLDCHQTPWMHTEVAEHTPLWFWSGLTRELVAWKKPCWKSIQWRYPPRGQNKRWVHWWHGLTSRPHFWRILEPRVTLRTIVWLHFLIARWIVWCLCLFLALDFDWLRPKRLDQVGGYWVPMPQWLLHILAVQELCHGCWYKNLFKFKISCPDFKITMFLKMLNHSWKRLGR